MIKFTDYEVKKYDYIEECFTEDILLIWKDYKIHLVDKNGREVKYDSDITKVDLFSSGLSMVKKNEKYGFINKKGEVVIPFMYDSAFAFDGDYTVVSKIEDSKEKNYIINNKNRIIREVDTDSHIKFVTDKYNVITDGHKNKYLDKKGNEVKKYDEANPFYSGYAIVKNNNTYKVIDEDFNVIKKIDKKYTYIRYVGCGMYLTKMSNCDQVGCINYLGEEVMPCVLEKYFEFNDDIANVYINDYCHAYLTKDGSLKLIPIEKYDEMNSFCEGLALVLKDKKYGFVDKNFKEVIPCKYKDAANFSCGLSYVKDFNGEKYFIDKKGNKVLDLKEYNSVMETDDETVIINAKTKEELLEKKLEMFNIKKDEEIKKYKDLESDLLTDMIDNEYSKKIMKIKNKK